MAFVLVLKFEPVNVFLYNVLLQMVREKVGWDGMGWVGWKVHIIIIPVWDASIDNARLGKCLIDKPRIQ